MAFDDNDTVRARSYSGHCLAPSASGGFIKVIVEKLVRNENAVRIAGFVDTLLIDPVSQNLSFNGWAVVEANAAETLEFRVTLQDKELPVRTSRHERADLTNYPPLELGFRIEVTNSENRKVIGAGSISVFARLKNAKNGWQELVIGDLANEQLLRHAWLEQASRLNKDQLNSLALEVLPKLASLTDTHSAMSTTSRSNGPLTKAASIEIYVPIGTRSLDGSCILGGKGHAFLIGGSNGVLGGYTAERGSSQIADASEQWVELFKQRKTECDRRGIIYMQSIIPEKISVMSEISGFSLQTPSPILESIEERLSQTDILYHSAYSDLSHSPDRLRSYDRIDTHLSTIGAFTLFLSMLKIVGVQTDIDPVFVDDERMVIGDISERFFPNTPIVYQDISMSTLPYPLSDSELELIEEINPNENGHIGLRRVFRNPFAADQRKLVVFGNSFFERGGHPKFLTWWFARLFGELHFLWLPQFDWGYVDQVAPDIVIGQTIERFLGRTPAS